MYYYGNGYGGAPMTGGYAPYGNVYPIQNNNTSLWAIILVVFILFIIIGCGFGGRGCGNWGGCC